MFISFLAYIKLYIFWSICSLFSIILSIYLLEQIFLFWLIIFAFLIKFVFSINSLIPSSRGFLELYILDEYVGIVKKLFFDNNLCFSKYSSDIVFVIVQFSNVSFVINELNLVIKKLDLSISLYFSLLNNLLFKISLWNENIELFFGFFFNLFL